ncbi:putative peptide modification system cyclase [Lysobacter fragariae]
MDTGYAQTSPEPLPEPAPRAGVNAPQLRTLLLTDLVDSTSLVERLGDGPASDLFRAHDRLVLQLQQQWRGRLIDRSDGLLLLFERPIDGLGFALDYARGLETLGTDNKLKLQARAGLHVGEVLTWRNSDEAVNVGAKPLEVEGLAKPMAARLMAMARPGQILLSAVAEPLAHRAARELGDRGQHLVWKSWGRWRFKGVPETQEIFEVGEPGVAPIRVPISSPKAWRDIPLWRRPAALAAEIALLVGGAIGVWFITQPAPAIAFNQRDWVVVGDLRNLTGQSALDDSLEQAFRISLEQSRYVNVLSDLKARDTLTRMQRPDDTVLDRAIASEIALRDGARAVILPTVAEVGGRVRVSAEVIDPHTQATVYAESVDGKGVESVLGSIDQVTASLRGKLGEAVKSIEKDSEPLPEVTTKNLDALRAYALGQKAYARNAYGEASQLFERATALDPTFALAWLGQMRAKYAQVNSPAAIAPLRKAQSLRDHLPPRDAMYLDAWAAEFDHPAEATSRWIELAKLYPGYFPAQGNAAFWLYEENRFAEAIPHARAAAVPQNELAPKDHDALGRILLGSEDFESAAHAFDRAMSLGFSSSLRRRVAVEAAKRDFMAARRIARKLPANDRHSRIELTSLAIDQAKWHQAQEDSKEALALAAGTGFDHRSLLLSAATADWFAGRKDEALGAAQSAAHQALQSLAQPEDADRKDDAALAMSAGLLALRMGDRQTAAEVREALARQPELMRTPVLSELFLVLGAEESRVSGRPEKALDALRPLITGHERYQTRVVLMESLAAVGQHEAALENARWLQRRRGLAYAEFECGYCLQALNVADSNIAALREAELLALTEQGTETVKIALRGFDRHWPAKALPDYLRDRRSAVIAASKLGEL